MDHSNAMGVDFFVAFGAYYHDHHTYIIKGRRPLEMSGYGINNHKSSRFKDYWHLLC